MEIIRLKDIRFAYPARSPLFKMLNFSFSAGQKIGIMGPNGAGKTTFLQLIVGLLKPQAGKVIIFGRPRKDESDFYEVRQRIGFLFQDPDDQLFCPTVEEEIAFGPLNLGIPRPQLPGLIKEMLSLVGLEGFEKRVTYKLSGGEKRLVALAAVLAMRPEVLLLDEPTGDLDQKNTMRLIDILNRLSLSYIIVSHDKSFLEKVTSSIYWFENERFLPLSSFPR
jgi:cobalt/nickel transport system ATP-binding protein